MSIKDTLKGSLEEICDVLTFQNLDGEFQLGIMNIKEQNARYLSTIEEIVECDAQCAVLLIHALDEEMDRVAIGGIPHKELDRLHCTVYSLQQIKEINEELNGGDDYEH